MNAARIDPVYNVFFWLLLAWGTGVPVGPVHADVTLPQRSPLAPPDTIDVGVVWTPPSNPAAARRSLTRIRNVGATAVRLTRVPSDSTAARADSLGLRLYVDLPVSAVSGVRAQRLLQGSPPSIDSLQSLARRHPSIAYVGLAHSVDTTTPRVCNALTGWTKKLHAATPTLQSYYVTPFHAEADRCVHAVDRVLLDLRGSPAPVDAWTRWRSTEPRVGIGALGTWVDPEAAPGLRTPHSPERQARYLERALAAMLDSTATAPPTIFVDRWQDHPSRLLPSRRFGLHDLAKRPRPAKAVARGFFSETQRVFAFQSGNSPEPENPFVVILGWALLVLVGGIYAQSVFVQRTVSRYFAAHGFYRDAIREGRNLHPGLNGLLLGALSSALGATATLAARLAADAPGTGRILAALPSEVGSVLARGVEHPVGAGGTVAGLTLGLAVFWTIVLVVVARRWTRFSLSQGLVLVVWPGWPALLGLPVALAAAPGAPLSPRLLALSLLAGGTLALVYHTLGVLSDYQAVSGLPWGVVLLLGGLSPLSLLTIIVLVTDLSYDIPFAFLWRLATQT